MLWHQLMVAALTFLLAEVVRVDIATRHIPKRLNVAIALLGIAHASYDAPAIVTIAGCVLHAMATGLTVNAAALLVRRIEPAAPIGGGDVKFLMAAACWVGTAGSLSVLLIAAAVTTIGAAAAMPWRRIGWRQSVPFGPMLAAGLILVVARTAVPR